MSRSSRAAKSSAINNLFHHPAHSPINSDEEPTYSDEEGDEDSSSEDEAEIQNPGDWHFVEPDRDSRLTDMPEFLGTPGINPLLDVPENVEDISFFVDLFLSSKLFSTIAKWTNERHEIYRSDNELAKEWDSVTEDEMRKYFGLSLLMGLNKKPELHLYWSKDEKYFSPFFERMECLPRDRFFSITKFVRFASYNSLSTDSKSEDKILPFCDMVRDICMNNYLPEREISVDETVLLFKGRLHFRQYVPNKRARYGLKTFVLSEASTGYVWNFLLYSGKNTWDDEINCSLKKSEQVVVQLSRPLFDLGYHIFLDNWFSSCALAEYLLEYDTLLTGTIRSNRGPPPQLRNRNFQAQQCLFMRKGDVLISRYDDKKASGKKLIYMIDSFSHAGTTEVVSRSKDRVSTAVSKPNSVLLYNKNMGGVDLADRCLEPYSPTRKTYTSGLPNTLFT